MSSRLNQRLSFWKDVLAELGRIDILWKGSPLSRRDQRTYHHMIVMWGMLLDDIDLLHDVDDSEKRRWAIAIAQIDVLSLARTLPDLILHCRTLSKGSGMLDENYLPFQVGDAAVICGPVQGLILEFLDHRTASTFSPVVQFLSFPTRLTLLDLDNISELEDEFCRVENEVREHKIPAFIIDDCNRIARSWFADFRIKDFYPSHGKGAIAELEGERGVWNPKKDQCLGTDQFLRSALRFSSGIEAKDWLPPERRESSFERTSKVVFVPKSLKTKRVISKEPATLMYFEKAIQREIYHYVSRHPVLRTKIDFVDQTPQRVYALNASRTRSHATIDLSSASDHLSYDLVKKVFRGTPLLPYLMALRSRYSVLPSGKVVELAKFAPMGSALTFPIQTLIFACLAESASGYVGATTGVFDTDYRIFGDDIIVPECLVQDMMDNLRLAGFVINEEKTWRGSYAFRESCGCDAYDGVDVTPMKISRGFSAVGVSSKSPGTFTSLIDLANSCQRYGFPTLRSFLIKELLQSSYPPLFSEDGNVGLFSPQPTNYHLQRRWSVDYQREEAKYGTIRSRIRQSTSPAEGNFSSRSEQRPGREPFHFGHREYWVWLRGTSNRDVGPFYPDDRFLVEEVAGNPVTTLTNRWGMIPTAG